MKKLMSFVEYAKHRGVSKQAVSKAVKEGRITVTIDPIKGGRSIDPAKADVEWKANTVEGQKSATGENGKQIEEPSPEEKKKPSYADHRAIREAYSARMLGLEYKEKVGSLINAERVKQDAYRLARIVRDSILNLPDRMAPELAAETDPHTVQVMLTKALIEALDQLVRSHVK